jgi:hypothetical protein
MKFGFEKAGPTWDAIELASAMEPEEKIYNKTLLL